MVTLGVGKNMVRSMRFWIQAFGLAGMTQDSGRGLVPTPLADTLLDRDEGWDPYLEDTQTLWILHWNLATNENPLLAWDELLFRWSGREIIRSSAVAQLKERAVEHKMRATKRTLEQHFDIFVGTYFSAKVADSSKVLEDSLDCPLAELRLLQAAGKKPRDRGAPEQMYQFRHESKPEIGAGVFLHCLSDFWAKRHSDEQTLGLQQLVSAWHSPGMVFRLPEAAIQNRLESIEKDSNGYYKYVESVSLRQLRRSEEDAPDFLASAFAEGVSHG